MHRHDHLKLHPRPRRRPRPLHQRRSGRPRTGSRSGRARHLLSRRGGTTPNLRRRRNRLSQPLLRRHRRTHKTPHSRPHPTMPLPRRPRLEPIELRLTPPRRRTGIPSHVRHSRLRCGCQTPITQTRQGTHTRLGSHRPPRGVAPRSPAARRVEPIRRTRHSNRRVSPCSPRMALQRRSNETSAPRCRVARLELPAPRGAAPIRSRDQ
jgi:hypothetical protein